MFFLFNDDRPWFRPKRYGIGAGLPTSWRGALFLALHIAAIVGVLLLLDGHPWVQMAMAVILGLAPAPLYAAKTEGGWRWRWGDEQ